MNTITISLITSNINLKITKAITIIFTCLLLCSSCENPFSNITSIKNSVLGDDYKSLTLGDALDNYKYFDKTEWLYRDWETDRKSTRLNSSHSGESRMPSSA